MFCEHFRLTISESLDAGTEPEAGTLKHIAKCKECREYYNTIKKLDSVLACEPDPLSGYDFSRLNQSISKKIDKAEPVDTEALHYPKAKFSYNFAIAATFIIAATLALSIFVNSTTPSTNPPSTFVQNHGEGTLVVDANNDNSNITTSPQRTFTASPQLALIYLSYSKLDKEEVKTKFEEGKEFYEKTQEISEKSYDIINTALYNSHLISLLF